MRLYISVLVGTLFLSFSVMAENNPYRNDLFWVTVPDHADWIYRVGEMASVEIQVYQYGIPLDGVTVEYEIGADKMLGDTKGTAILKNGRTTISLGTMTKPGFRDCRMKIKLGNQVSRHHVKVGFSPEKILPYTQIPADFEAFWKKKLSEMAEYPLHYSKEFCAEYSTDKIDCYLIRLFLNEQGQSVYAYLFYPKNAPKASCPVVLCPPGAGIKTIKNPLRHKYYAEQGCIRMEFEIHGLNPKLSAEDFKDISLAFNSKENGYLSIGMENRDHYYMKRVYLACIRCIDFLTSLPEWDGKNVITQGGSQGGALALVAAALDKRVTACVANHPALSDMAGYLDGRAGGYPHFFREKGMNTPSKVETLAYYDVVNFARFIRIPVYMTWGFNDDTCPPTTSYAVYNSISSFKEALITPINEHWTSEQTERAHLIWIKQHLIP